MSENNEDTKTETVVFGGGCFWCTEAVFKMIKGIISAEPGYAGGETTNPTYEEVSMGDTGHVEVVKIEYNPELLSFQNLLTIFFATHDPTTLNKQGNDVGTQYRSAVFYTTERQKEETEKFIAELNASNTEGKSVVTEIKRLGAFYLAEDYHKNYYENHKENPYCEIVINPKLEKVQKNFSELLKENKN